MIRGYEWLCWFLWGSTVERVWQRLGDGDATGIAAALVAQAATLGMIYLWAHYRITRRQTP